MFSRRERRIIAQHGAKRNAGNEAHREVASRRDAVKIVANTIIAGFTVAKNSFGAARSVRARLQSCRQMANKELGFSP